MMAGIRPAFTISSRSSSSRLRGATWIFTGALPCALSFSLSAIRLSLVDAASRGRTLPCPTGRRPRRSAGAPAAGDQDLVDVGAGGIAEVDELLELGPHRDLRRDQVDLALDQRRKQHVARQRHEEHVDLVVVAGLEVLVQPLLHELAVLVRHAALHALVDEVERAVERHADPHQPALDHLVEVAGERLQDGSRARPRAAAVSSSEGGSGASASSAAPEAAAAGACASAPGGWSSPHAVIVIRTPAISTAVHSILAIMLPSSNSVERRSQRTWRTRGGARIVQARSGQRDDCR